MHGREMSLRSTEPARSSRAPIQFPPELPISARMGDIAAALSDHQVVIVVGATGSGKTTQLPKLALDLGRGGRRLIGVTQPRRLAATSVAARVASELKCVLGEEVGYQIRFEDRTCANTWVKFMTDGILLAEIQGDRLLSRYDTLIIDEAHERSLTIDFILGWLKHILPQRPDLKIIVSSATIETERFSEFFDGAPVISVEGRTYPVEVLYEPPASEIDPADAVADAVVNVTSLDPRGDILVFLPGEREIRECEHALLAKNLRHTEVLPLYGRLSAAEQGRVFSSTPLRRVVLATNVAETSLTIPGIVYVIDTGLARLSRYDPRTGTTRLQIEAISQASADQRKGRCGRVREGICIRLYDEQSFAARSAFTDPEMKRTGLAGVILRMKALGLGAVEDFAFLDPPRPNAVTEGYRVLQELGALDRERELSPRGEQLARFPVDPQLGRMILAGAEFGCLPEVLTVVAALNVQDPRERPRGLEQKADQRHQPFRVEHSDFVGLLRLWAFISEQQAKGTSQLRRACKENFLNFLRVREWAEVRQQLQDVAKERRLRTPMPREGGKSGKSNGPDADSDRSGKGKNPSAGKSSKAKSPATDAGKSASPTTPPADASNASEHPAADALHLALLTGLLSKIGLWNSEQRSYQGARQTRFVIHPSSGLAKKPPAWIMAFELVQTSQLFARTSAKVEPAWLDLVGNHLLKRSYSEPHWSEKSGRASVREHATLYGLPVLRDRSVDYSTIAPEHARQIFIEHALVRGEYKSQGSFQQKNQQILAQAARLRDKARQSDMLTDDAQLYTFFDQRIPEAIVNGKMFEAWRRDEEQRNPQLLQLSLADVIAADPRLAPDRYPDSITFHGVKLAATYRFEPTADDDGVSLDIPLAILPQLEGGQLDWTIPAWHEEKIAALVNALPRALRRELPPTSELVATLAPRLTAFGEPMLPALARAASEATGRHITEDEFRVEAIPAHLRFNFRLLDEAGHMLAQSRDASLLLSQFGVRAREVLSRSARPAEWTRSGITRWDFRDLPRFVLLRVGQTELRSYPALVDRKTSVELTLLATEELADAANLEGIRRLLLLACRGSLSEFGKRVPNPFRTRSGLPPSSSEKNAFRDAVLERVVDEAFGLSNAATLPRTKADFERLLAAGERQLAPVFETTVRAIITASSELEQTVRALNNAKKTPSGAAAIAEIWTQLEQMFVPELIATAQLQRLQLIPRYLKAAQLRLQRAVLDPRKDAGKAAPLLPLWAKFLAKQAAATDRHAAIQLKWDFEDLRVAIFAPELYRSTSVTVASIADKVAKLR
jgi:ATP-dependent helicase HrpA